MISKICGKVISINHQNEEVSIDVHTAGGVVYNIVVVDNFAMPGINDELCIEVVLVVREDKWVLYGFNNKKQKDWFYRLRNVSGIGPKTALNILGTFSLEQFLELLQNSDAVALSKVKGLGLKGAKKIILDLQGVIAETTEKGEIDLIKELREALKSLGFQPEVINEFVEKAMELIEEDKNISIETLIEKVLQDR